VKKDPKEVIKTLFLTLLTIEALIWTFFDRRYLTLAIASVMIVQLKQCPSRQLMALWIGLCTSVMAFSFQPSVGKERSPWLVLAGSLLSSAIMSYIGLLLAFKKGRQMAVFAILVSFLSLSGLCVLYPQDLKGLSWIILLTSLPLALTSTPSLLQRLLTLNLALQAIYTLFSLYYEGLFITCLTLTLLVWLILEHRKTFAYTSLESIPMLASPRQRHILTSDDLGIALTFLTFTIVAFFGTGNIASLNSFDPRSIQTLVTVFNPFLMGGLLLLKVIIPFFVVALMAFSVAYVSQMPIQALFLNVLLFSDIMGMHFFFMVTDQGSWLDIGTSLSHFIIVQATVIFLQLLFLLSSFCMKMSITNPIHDSFTDGFSVKHK
jgi:phosphatidylinositol glycan class N